MNEQRKSVLVIGDVMLDCRVEGEMRRISPESPSPVVHKSESRELPGGAANVAANVFALGCPTLLLGIVGDDPAGATLCRMMPEQYGVGSCLIRYPGLRTTTKTRVTCSGQQVIRVDEEQQLSPDYVADHNCNVISSLQGLFPQDTIVGVIVISDYAKGMMTSDIVQFLQDAARVHGIPILVDTKPCNFDLYRGVTLIKPNLKEALEVCSTNVHPGLSVTADEETKAEVLARCIHADYGVQSVVVTRGANGATCYDGRELFTSSVKGQEVFDVTGAGDTFLATLAQAAMFGYDLPSALVRANTAAGEVVRHHGTHIIDRDSLEEAVKNRLGFRGKILTREQVVAFANRRRARGECVVLANGCFRFLHEGHWELLQWARRRGDTLIVAANSDASIDELRGEVPYVPQSYRGEMLACLPFVDAVVFFDEPSAEQIVRDITPHVLVKGAEYQHDAVPGSDWVAKHGGEVAFAPMLSGASATRLATQQVDST